MNAVWIAFLLFTIAYGTTCSVSLRRSKRDAQALLRRLEDLAIRVRNLEVDLSLEKYVTKGLQIELQRLKPAPKAETVVEVTQTADAREGSAELPENVIQKFADIARREYTSRLDVITSGLIYEKKRTFQVAEFCRKTLTKMTSRLDAFSENFVEFGGRLDAANQSTTKLAKRMSGFPEIVTNLEDRISDVDGTGNHLKERIDCVNGTLDKFNNRLTSLNVTVTGLKKINCSICMAEELNGATSGMTTQAPKKCPSGWVFFDGSCYYFQLEQTLLTQKAASVQCTTKYRGSSLVAIETREEFDFLKQYLQSRHDSIRERTSSGWLTAGKKIDGHWKWETTGLSFNLSAITWGRGEPDDQTCASLWPYLDFDLADVYCRSFFRQYICEL